MNNLPGDPPADFLEATTQPVMVRCAKCGDRARGTLYVVNLGPIGSASWFKAPAGWWLLLPVVPPPGDELTQWQPHARCPSCFDPRKAAAATARLRGEGDAA